jgi:hypothetical protein
VETAHCESHGPLDTLVLRVAAYQDAATLTKGGPMERKEYVPPAITEIASLHELTLSTVKYVSQTSDGYYLGAPGTNNTLPLNTLPSGS